MTAPLTDRHVHTHRCWWDFRDARWTCRPSSQIVTLGEVVGDVPASPPGRS